MLKKTEKILIIKHGAFGDLIQCDGVLRDIRAHYDNAEIALLTSPTYVSMMQQCPHIDRVLSDARAPIWHITTQTKLFQQLSSEHFSQVIDLQNSDRSRLYHRWVFPHTPWLGREKHVRIESGLKGQVALLKEAKIPVHHALQPDMRWLSSDIQGLLEPPQRQQPYIALIPGCSAQHPEKRWPHYPQLADALIGDGFEVINILGPDELDLADDLPGYSPAIEHGILNWSQLAGLLEQAAFVIGNDTGPSHLASCLQRPGLALFGGTTSVQKAEIVRGEFNAIKVDNLALLSFESVLAEVLPKLPTPNPHPTKPVPQPSY